MLDIFKEIAEAREGGTPAVLATVVEVTGSAPGTAGNRMLVRSDGSASGTIGGGAIEKKILEEAATMVGTAGTRLQHYDLAGLDMSCGGAMRVFLEPLNPAPELIVFGAGHIGQVLCKLGNLLGFRVTVADNRPEFAGPDRLPEADRIIGRPYPEALKELQFTENSHIVIVTHRHANDFEALAHCVRQPFAYLGMIGSRGKVAKAFDQLRAEGITEEVIGRVHAPVGIDIGARTPAEIALSIAAQLVAERSGTAAAGMKS